EIRPTDGRRPETPLKAAGRRTEPPVSLPSAPAQKPAATAAPEPPLEPPGMRVVFQGLSVCPPTELTLRTPYANSCRLVLPTIAAPARRSRSTTGASAFGTWSLKNFE